MCVYRWILKYIVFLSNVTFLFPAVDRIENAQRYNEIHSVLLPMHTVATAVRAMCKCCGWVFWCYSQSSFLIMPVNYNFVTGVLFLISLFSYCLLWYWQEKQPYPGEKIGQFCLVTINSDETSMADWSIPQSLHAIAGTATWTGAWGWLVGLDEMARCLIKHRGTTSLPILRYRVIKIL